MLFVAIRALSPIPIIPASQPGGFLVYLPARFMIESRFAGQLDARLRVPAGDGNRLMSLVSGLL